MVCGVCEDSEEVKKVDGVAIVLKDYEERRTTDVLYLLILIATWVAMTILGAISIQNGDINRLINPYNNEVRIQNLVYFTCALLFDERNLLTFFFFSPKLIDNLYS